MQRRRFLPLLSLITLAAFALPAWAKGTVQLELIGDAQGSAMLFQEWGQALGQAGIRNVRIRGAQETDKVGIETLGTADSPVYVVTGKILSHDELQLPGGRFRRSEAARLAQWLKDLAERGPTAGKEEKVAFGLSAAEFQKVRADLATSVGSPTQGLTRRQVVQNIAARLKLPLKLDADVARALSDDKVVEDLGNFACGTALAYVLRPAGYCLVPHAAGGETAYMVVKSQPKLEVWQVGWAPERPANEIVPGLFEFRDVNVQNAAASALLEAVGQRIKTPVLIDHNALARHGIDPAKAMVTLPRSKTTYSIALRKLLFQAGMKYEVRCDEAGMPFLWISSVKPI